MTLDRWDIEYLKKSKQVLKPIRKKYEKYISKDEGVFHYWKHSADSQEVINKMTEDDVLVRILEESKDFYVFAGRPRYIWFLVKELHSGLGHNTFAEVYDVQNGSKDFLCLKLTSTGEKGDFLKLFNEDFGLKYTGSSRNKFKELPIDIYGKDLISKLDGSVILKNAFDGWTCTQEEIKDIIIDYIEDNEDQLRAAGWE